MNKFAMSIFCLFLCNSVFAGQLNVSGVGSVNATPDFATLSFAVVTEGKTAHEAAKKNADLMSRVMNAVDKLELPKKDISTSNYNISLVYESVNTLKGSKSVVVGYKAVNQVTVKICEIKKVSAVIDGLVKAGVNRTGNLRFGFSNLSSLQDKARVLAVADAKRKADIYANALGVVVNVVPKSFSEQVNYHGRVYQRSSLSFNAADSSTPVSVGESTVTVSVHVVWEMKNK